jgi:hypothetical protein
VRSHPLDAFAPGDVPASEGHPPSGTPIPGMQLHLKTVAASAPLQSNWVQAPPPEQAFPTSASAQSASEAKLSHVCSVAARPGAAQATPTARIANRIRFDGNDIRSLPTATLMPARSVHSPHRLRVARTAGTQFFEPRRHSSLTRALSSLDRQLARRRSSSLLEPGPAAGPRRLEEPRRSHLPEHRSGEAD